MFRLINNLKNRKGFTLIELIVVLAVLAIIMAIAVPRFLGVQQEAKENADKATLEMISKAAELYYAKGGTTVTIANLVSGGYLESGLKFQVDGVAISDSNTTITVSATSGAITVTRP